MKSMFFIPTLMHNCDPGVYHIKAPVTFNGSYVNLFVIPCFRL